MAAPKGGNRGSFKPGDPRRKRNPRKGTGVPSDLKEAAKLRTGEALAYLERAIRQRRITASGITAALAILERGWGRVPLPVEAKLEDTRDYHVTIKLVESNTEPERLEEGSQEADPRIVSLPITRFASAESPIG